ncbi:hypothetical protein [Neisseria meningitidis]|uniref:hypothetical protein n=1 Tax=Neisseria meningitidis TaxID=487 RepID=UPI00118739AE|nr:hypothetical protein [Neisseria meningitidis]
MNRHSHTLRHSRENGNLERRVEETVLSDKFLRRQGWIPACAGMTARGCRLKRWAEAHPTIVSEASPTIVSASIPFGGIFSIL